jgi:hypothetical protein
MNVLRRNAININTFSHIYSVDRLHAIRSRYHVWKLQRPRRYHRLRHRLHHRLHHRLGQRHQLLTGLTRRPRYPRITRRSNRPKRQTTRKCLAAQARHLRAAHRQADDCHPSALSGGLRLPAVHQLTRLEIKLRDPRPEPNHPEHPLRLDVLAEAV